jgi:hypothetical protein
MEEDTGKTTHGSASGRIHEADFALIDYNRAGVPLVECVSEPDMRSPEEAAAYLRELRATLESLDVSDVRMEEGSLRCDANISLRPVGQTEFGTKVEIKNMNSVRSMERALNFEIARQTGHVILNTATDRPWSNYFCCMVLANRDFVQRYPVATKRVLRAILQFAVVTGSYRWRSTNAGSTLTARRRFGALAQFGRMLPAAIGQRRRLRRRQTVPDREIVVGAVTQPWLGDVVFRALPPAEFAAFHQPGFVKIAWTLRADPAGERGSIFRSETRVIATDADARARFRWYWARFSPGITVIRRLMLGPVKAEAERRARWP